MKENAAPPVPGGRAGTIGEPMKRRCLRCDRSFTARGRFNRLCMGCRKIPAGGNTQPYPGSR